MAASLLAALIIFFSALLDRKMMTVSLKRSRQACSGDNPSVLPRALSPVLQ